MGVARDSHRRCIYYLEHVYMWRDIVITPLVIPSTCIRERDIVIAPLVPVCVCVSVCLCVCLHLIAS